MKLRTARTDPSGLLPVATMLEKRGFPATDRGNLTLKRQTCAMPVLRFILGMIPACYVSFFRLHHLRFLKRGQMRTGILHVVELPPQCTFWLGCEQRGNIIGGFHTNNPRMTFAELRYCFHF
jgi:hypothetical protein